MDRYRNWIAGLDGCRAGWIAVLRPLDPAHAPAAKPEIRVVPRLETLLAFAPDLAAIAIDMPIGLPERISGAGRPAEQAVRPLLGARRASLFSIPVRAAVEAADYAEACRLAALGSDPPRKIARQSFNLFPKILEIDRALRADPELVARMVETHPEFVFRQLKGAPLEHGKKTPAGADERRALLQAAGIGEDLLRAGSPRGAAGDDLRDAIACSLTAERFARGEARPNPQPFSRDRHGLPIAIWA